LTMRRCITRKNHWIIRAVRVQVNGVSALNPGFNRCDFVLLVIRTNRWKEFDKRRRAFIGAFWICEWDSVWPDCAGLCQLESTAVALSSNGMRICWGEL
jgi:hypothetical protein